ncbi:Hypothetical protein LOCK908_0254 [Lacticaseibacillus rhamnosus LOCK908]|uniref:Uncharacterized protein n=1 Tax=Lacticaseibacillus rhamnosus (strain LMS2-1) TaxID=525361 RepID=C2JT73_LACRM|nr:conserved hypothetical protein [Lacticaseibacillus rhamnosus ATCC 8530]AGP72941.1 Hypothetical protein LOCK908_0254 [Lacticaseibacillus rhamnosus LOCK908]EEN81774.1 hypothetical protein HMPREF0539_0107 [Lacticaseibacillus rhamnosus LMS2-1]
MASTVMAGLWPLRLRSLHAGFWVKKRVMMEQDHEALNFMGG